MIAHAGDRAGGRRAGVRAHHVHQAGARPPGVAVEAGPVRLLARLAVTGEGRVDQPRIEGSDVVISDAEAPPHRRRIIGDEDVGVGDEAMEHRPRVRLGEVERDALLVAALEQPGVVVRSGRVAGNFGQRAIGIAAAGRLDLDHVGAEIGQHRRGRRRGNEARAVDDLEAGEDSLLHFLLPAHAALALAQSWASTTATAVMLTTPRAVTDGVRMCAGRAAPTRIGPTGSASPSTLISS
jgi:hypothetical protein